MSDLKLEGDLILPFNIKRQKFICIDTDGVQLTRNTIYEGVLVELAYEKNKVNIQNDAGVWVLVKAGRMMFLKEEV